MIQEFWSEQNLLAHADQNIFIQADSFSYRDLNNAANKLITEYELSHFINDIVFIQMGYDLSSIASYIACLRSKVVPLLLPSNIHKELLEQLSKIYEPKYIFSNRNVTKGEKFSHKSSEHSVNSQLRLLLSTSGSTGSPKLVRLSEKNIVSNTTSIIEYLNITKKEVLLCSMPLSYSYGLSLLNTHLSVGSAMHLVDISPLNKDYYEYLETHKVTSIHGVPFFFQILFRTGFLDRENKSIRTITQAGGKLSEKLAEKFNVFAQNNNIDFFVMYGQTEASPRISYVPPHSLSAHLNSIGIAIPGGELSLSNDDELIYKGPNVMLGYASQREDLSLGDINNGILNTGDLGYEKDGFFYITGRKKRFVKIAGSRYSLDQIELRLEEGLNIETLVIGNDSKIFIKYSSKEDEDKNIFNIIQSEFLLNKTFIDVEKINKIPYKANGKKDHFAIKV